jgi:hypothetical protein
MELIRGFLRTRPDTAILARYARNNSDSEGLEEDLASSLRWSFFSYRGLGVVTGSIEVFVFQQRHGCW